MTNINLYQSSSKDTRNKQKLSVMDTGIFWSIGLLFLTMALFGGLKIFSEDLNKKNEAIKSEIKNEIESFAGGALNRVVDFQTRMNEGVKNIDLKADENAIFNSLEDSIIENVVVESFSYSIDDIEKKSVVYIEMICNDFVSVAQQVLSFKENSFFENVYLQEVSRDDESISFEITANLK